MTPKAILPVKSSAQCMALLKNKIWGNWVSRSVKRLTWAQVMILRFMGLSPASGSGLTVRSLLGILPLSLSLSLCPSPERSLSLSE